jgi:hypothetical protein
MQIAFFILMQVFSYSVLTWLAFLLIALLAARYGGWGLAPVGHLAIAAIIVLLDYRWIQYEMHKPGWDGTPDMDIIFYFGVLIRIPLLNTILLPVTGIGIWLRQRAARDACQCA